MLGSRAPALRSGSIFRGTRALTTSPYEGHARIKASPMTSFKQTMDRLSYGYMMEDMFRGLFLTTEVMFKPSCVPVSLDWGMHVLVLGVFA